MELKSPDFDHEGPIPTRFTCDGEDLSPELVWNGVPSNTKSFALTCIDPDAPRGDFIHWLLHDIPADTKKLLRGEPPFGVEVINDFGKFSYGGPCPPSGTHRYYFRLYALDVKEIGPLSKADFVEEVKKHAIAEAVLMGTYKRI